ncbi:MAG: PepSY domain-containing protein [Acidobacteriota bacterium]|nr:PepSY domain-containing protein [Acidobacteriota bacterium]
MKTFRKIIFWLHLTAGVFAGIVILIMSVTGALLAFQPQIEAFIESDVRKIQVPENAQRLDIQTLLSRVQTAKPEIKPTNLTIKSELGEAAALALGREGTLYVNPYTGEITGENSKSARAFFQFTTDWHRWLALSGENRAIGKAITGACNLAFLVLAITGIYLWFPRRWSWKNVKAVGVFRFDQKGKARDFNWHNVAGIWTSLVLIVLTATAVVISYQWASNLVYYATGNTPPAPQQPAPQQQQSNNNARFVVPENVSFLFSRAEQQAPGWKSIALRLPISETAVFTVDEGKYLNKFGRSTLTLNANTAETIKWESYGEQNAGRQLRSWMRFTHTGESFGIVGQIIAFIGCLGGSLLVWTGLALALRRFRGWLAKRSSNSPAATVSVTENE